MTRIQHPRLSRLHDLIWVDHDIVVDTYNLTYYVDGAKMPVRCNQHFIEGILASFADKAHRACF